MLPFKHLFFALFVWGSVFLPKWSMAADFQFDGQPYFFRWTNGTLFELTPEGQSDLNDWQEMVSFVIFSDANNGEALAENANRILGNYQSHKGMLLATNSIPATKQQPAEHFMAYLFIEPERFEFAANRIVQLENYGVSLVYSKRFYNNKGEDGHSVSRWMEAQGPKIEEALKAIPKHQIQAVSQSLLDNHRNNKGSE